MIVFEGPALSAWAWGTFMRHYSWAIHTADRRNAGTDATISLALQGSLARLAEVELHDPESYNDFERNDTNHGVLEVADSDDLGELLSGTLREDGRGSGPGWAVDWIEIRADDGQRWRADVGGKFSDEEGTSRSFDLEFVRVRGPRAGTAKWEAEQAAAARKQGQADSKSAAKKAVPEKREVVDADDPKLVAARKKAHARITTLLTPESRKNGAYRPGRPKVSVRPQLIQDATAEGVQTASDDYYVGHQADDGSWAQGGPLEQRAAQVLAAQLHREGYTPHVWRPGWPDWQALPHPNDGDDSEDDDEPLADADALDPQASETEA